MKRFKSNKSDKTFMPRDQFNALMGRLVLCSTVETETQQDAKFQKIMQDFSPSYDKWVASRDGRQQKVATVIYKKLQALGCEGLLSALSEEQRNLFYQYCPPNKTQGHGTGNEPVDAGVATTAYRFLDNTATDVGQHQLPDISIDIMLLILLWLNPKDLSIACQVSRAWKQVASSNALWQNFIAPDHRLLPENCSNRQQRNVFFKTRFRQNPLERLPEYNTIYVTIGRYKNRAFTVEVRDSLNKMKNRTIIRAMLGPKPRPHYFYFYVGTHVNITANMVAEVLNLSEGLPFEQIILFSNGSKLGGLDVIPTVQSVGVQQPYIPSPPPGSSVYVGYSRHQQQQYCLSPAQHPHIIKVVSSKEFCALETNKVLPFEWTPPKEESRFKGKCTIS